MPESKSEVSRRSFVAAPFSAAALRARSSNDRIQVGVIGAGGRGFELMRQVAQAKGANAVITAICDVYRPNREKAVQFVEKTWGIKPRQTVDYKELLSWRDVDAVLIAAPDFTHSIMLKDAVEAGKDAYCEKPMGVEFNEAKAAYLAVRKSDRVVQIGTQRRSDPRLAGAARLVRSGILGQVTRVEFSVNFQEPRWRRDYTHIRPEDVAWPQFLMHRPSRPFDARRFREWQLFRDYTNGIAGLWMCHFIDLVPWFLDDPYPAGAVANGGVLPVEGRAGDFRRFPRLAGLPQRLPGQFRHEPDQRGGQPQSVVRNAGHTGCRRDENHGRRQPHARPADRRNQGARGADELAHGELPGVRARARHTARRHPGRLLARGRGLHGGSGPGSGQKNPVRSRQARTDRLSPCGAIDAPNIAAEGDSA
jgi:predicted dehydrogenase